MGGRGGGDWGAWLGVAGGGGGIEEFGYVEGGGIGEFS